MMPDLKENLAALRIDHNARDVRPARWMWLVVVVLGAAVAGGAWWWATRAQAANVRTVTVEAQQVGDEGPAVLNASGYVTARRRATVSSKVTGKVIEVNVEEGMAVRRGQVLARLDDSQVRASLALTEAQLLAARQAVAESEVRLAEAKLTLGRREQLAREGVIGKADVDAAQAEVDSLAARVALAREQVQVAERQVDAIRTDLADMTVRAPFDGVAISKDAQPGEMVSPVSAGGGFTRTGISTIVDMKSLEIEVDVNESYINRVKPSQEVIAVLDAYPDWRIPAHVITMVPTADRQKATVLVRIAFKALDPRILPDMGVKVTFLGDRDATAQQAARPQIFVPRTAVRSVDGRNIVYLVHNDRVERRAVTVGLTQGDRIEVLSGLNVGDRVVVDGPSDLADGDQVTTK